MKLKKTVKRLLFEAYRRNRMLDDRNESKDLQARWLGLGTRSAYQPILTAGLMTFVNPPAPKCMGWLHLTELGVKAMQEHEDEFSLVFDQMVLEGYAGTVLANYQLAGGLTG